MRNRAPAESKREQNKQANREAILRAALKVFHERGYDAITIRDIIRETPLAAGTFYNYFRDKETLFRALIGEPIHALTARLTSIRRGARTLEQFLFEAYCVVFEEITAHPDFYAMMFRNEPVIRALYSDNVMGLSMRALRADLADAIKRGLLPKMDEDYLTAILFGAGYEMARLLNARPEKSPREAAAFATQLFLEGVQKAGKIKLGPLIRRGSITHQGSAR
jgi:AcrR family transcriptional regulator